MRLEGRRTSENVEDRRRGPRPSVVGGGAGAGMLVLLLVVYLLGGNPQAVLQQLQPAAGDGAPAAAPVDLEQELTVEEEQQGIFSSQVLALTEDVWGQLLAEYGVRYQEPRMVLFSRRVNSACGAATSATGPFYCPGDSTVFLDTSFFSELSSKFGAPGDFARAYVIAHEVGHHIQNLLGTTDKLDALRGRISEREMNDLSVRLELQADFYAGVFAHHLRGEGRILEEGDIEEALRCAMAIGDDRLQKQARGYVVPDSFTHGTSQQRYNWFLKGFRTGDISQGDTFSATDL
ncbi:KPN_02809 family neutral zinc metallopeptidase [Planctomycetaceae bacterium SH139]